MLIFLCKSSLGRNEEIKKKNKQFGARNKQGEGNESLECRGMKSKHLRAQALTCRGIGIGGRGIQDEPG